MSNYLGVLLLVLGLFTAITELYSGPVQKAEFELQGGRYNICNDRTSRTSPSIGEEEQRMDAKKDPAYLIKRKDVPAMNGSNYYSSDGDFI